MARHLGGLKALLFTALLASSLARAADEPVRLDLRLMGADLVDEMVYNWLQTAPLSPPASLIVAEIDAPVAIDQRFEEDIENHLYELLRANPHLALSLVHCSLCRQSLTVSNPKRTVMGRALSMPEGQAKLAEYPHLHALSMHFDVVERELVLWAEIYEVAAPQRVVWSRRFSTATDARSLLREPGHLVSISEAREEQHKLMTGHDNIQFVTRFPVRTFAAGSVGVGSQVEIPPLIFLEQSVEAVVSPHRDRRAGISVGLTSVKDSMQGWSLGASYAELLGRSEPSLTQPDVYLRVAAVYLRLEGPGAALFSQNQIDVNHLINTDDSPKASLMAYQIGLEAHVKNRFGLSAFIEYIPVLDDSQVIATRHLLIPFHSVGVAGVFLW